MSHYFFTSNKYLVAILLFTLVTICSTAITIGEFKAINSIAWVDIIGEGGMMLMIFTWIVFTLISRPAGRVTTWLFTGLLLTEISMLLDFLDEFIHYAAHNSWFTTVESFPAAIGMVLMTFALYQLHFEQQTINTQLRRTERYYREHSLTDFVTQLYSAQYMKQQLKYELNHVKAHHSTFSLIMLDVRKFNDFNQRFGYAQGDFLLGEIAKLLLMNIRDGDLACRYASDRFIVLLPNTTANVARVISGHIEQAVAHLAYKSGDSSTAIYPKISSCVNQYQGQQSYQEILAQLNHKMSVVKYESTAARSDVTCTNVPVSN
ncbi:GGDEF domain-containing protein [Colwellia sp. D2M02]|uniref:diguanylate cyclase domain-containing protein n=1 Tax=Colwellia sp. D2M02 TaxID=2841562 RepID=UPI001C08C334|nr:diguanylate cyclase [Colwellia sp. D2M02]MBU2894762.1 GGDEF domain-containing protein [Colwellia sp. D2M02]